jgi:hypothetical protein
MKYEDGNGILNAFISYNIIRQNFIDYLNKHPHLLNVS